MLTTMTDLPDGVIGFSAEGTVTDADYKTVLIPAVEDTLKAGGKVRLLYFLGPQFEKYAPGAMWDDTMFGARHYFDFEKVACVTDHELLGCPEGQEAGFKCETCKDGIMGVHEAHKSQAATVVT